MEAEPLSAVALLRMWRRVDLWNDDEGDDGEYTPPPPRRPPPRWLLPDATGAHAEVLAIPARMRMEG